MIWRKGRSADCSNCSLLGFRVGPIIQQWLLTATVSNMLTYIWPTNPLTQFPAVYLQAVWVVSWFWCRDKWPRLSYSVTDDSSEAGVDMAALAWETEAFWRRSRFSLAVIHCDSRFSLAVIHCDSRFRLGIIHFDSRSSLLTYSL